MTLNLDRLWMIAPRTQPHYKQAFRLAPEVFPSFEIATPLRAQHFLAQVLHETGGLTVEIENLNYRVARLMQVWPSRFPSLAMAREYANQPQKLANYVYRGRLGNIMPDDGWTFRGRGLLQITGRENYTIVGRELGIPLVHDPELALDPFYALAVAACIWKLRGCNVAADNDDLQAVTRRINGGLVGLAERNVWLIRARTVVGDTEVKA